VWLLAVAAVFALLPVAAHAQAEGDAVRELPGEPTAEFVASEKFRAGSLILPLRTALKTPLALEGHYFGGEEANSGTVGASVLLPLLAGGTRLALAPGIAYLSGSEKPKSAAALTLRWDFETSAGKGAVVSEGLGVLALSEDESGNLPAISDGNHVSYRAPGRGPGGTGGFDLGFSWEYVHFREDHEWKTGARLAYQVAPTGSLVAYILGPDTEVRLGFLLHPPRARRVSE
jgi:hypothetical protein